MLQNDLMTKLLAPVGKFVDHWPFSVAAAVAAVALSMGGCETFFPITTVSPISGEVLTDDQLVAEHNKFVAEREAAVSEHLAQAKDHVAKALLLEGDTEEIGVQVVEAVDVIAKKREQRNGLMAQISSLIGTAIPGSEAVLGILTLGFAGDNVRKNFKIRQLKKQTGS